MEDLSRYWGIDRILFLTCCIVSIFLQAEANSTSGMVGSTVTLHCTSNTTGDLLQLTWGRNGTQLFSFRPQKTSNSSSVTLSRSAAAATLNLNMSTLESQSYALIIESAQKSHAGNYTCEITTDSGFIEQKWELVIIANSTSRMVGSTVTLHCTSNTTGDLLQLTWRRNGTQLFSFRPQKASNSSSVTLSRSPAAATLNLTMSTLESQSYALIIESAQKSHTGNYTCEITTDSGVIEQEWELVIIENAEAESSNKISKLTTIAIIVPSLCFLIFILTAVIILRGVCKRRSQTITQPPRRLVSVREPTQPTYENLDFEGRQQCGQIQVHPYKYRAE
ncbi:fibroblast growth factor receptor 3-like isoform X2 [Pundamilia nyererei]|uniref:Fibroblast growth factor receptor 3-like isoform X2 n=1 Tax=Pundamilia nyererei TaxID=303518 RepID=A0A9Y3QM30_9CICH|nr:PREDICTED: fibroblast growth factor receptor 3-like isoform X2 [Pundamilia nyererei]